MLTYQEVTQILKMVDASDCEEFILELDNIKLVIRRGSSGTTETALPAGHSSIKEATSPRSAVPTERSVSTQDANHHAEVVPQAHAAERVLRSPMVGTFYRRPSPDKPAFVEVGDIVEVGTPLCLIEVMKLYTTIESTVAGKIEAIHAQDAELVEYDQLLFVFSPVASV